MYKVEYIPAALGIGESESTVLHGLDDNGERSAAAAVRALFAITDYNEYVSALAPITSAAVDSTTRKRPRRM
jgi:hypothetical protein